MTPHAPVRRFVLDGLRATLTAHTAGTLPLSRLAWELTSRLDTLTPLVPLPQHRALTALRVAVHTVATLDTRAAGRPLDVTDQRTLHAALDTVSTALHAFHPAEVSTTAGTLEPPAPHAPAATFRPVVLPFPRTEMAAAANPPGDPASRPPGGDRTPAA